MPPAFPPRRPRIGPRGPSNPPAGTHAGDVAILETAMYDTVEHTADEELQRALQEALDRRD
ncbi:hypothetical protein IDM40_25465 [Nocardiopsis sp. HNM0947]|uniref:Uncharacterized protein n=1 Tax=Nocardiopsis coralli TaxID=2772213 RepID=A0ABR9PDU2_9ACTN|nr:hypothetical protein [Nocardiopsis coralli]MBE3002020.1 hypothetical protein [Nocardiopsis coralli]